MSEFKASSNSFEGYYHSVLSFAAPSDPEAESRAAASQVKSTLLQFALTIAVLQITPTVLKKLGVLSD